MSTLLSEAGHERVWAACERRMSRMLGVLYFMVALNAVLFAYQLAVLP